MAVEYPAQFAANKQGCRFGKPVGINMRFKFRLCKKNVETLWQFRRWFVWSTFVIKSWLY